MSGAERHTKVLTNVWTPSVQKSSLCRFNESYERTNANRLAKKVIKSQIVNQ